MLDWENARRLEADLQNLITTGEGEGFNHMRAYRREDEDLGCVACRCHVLAHGSLPLGMVTGQSGIREFLNCTGSEAQYLWIPGIASACIDGKGDWTGIKGVRNALTRLHEVMSHYTEEAPSAEATFLTEMRSFATAVAAGTVVIPEDVPVETL
jgi:hypothetical protein